MVFSSAIFAVAALASTYLAAPADAAIPAAAGQTPGAFDAKKLPWDGRAYDLTVDTLSKKYQTHILTMRNHSADSVVSKYVFIEPKDRSPAYNGDTGIINIGVDSKAIFKAQHNFRRSELVQKIDVNVGGTSFFRASLMKKDPFLNPYQWQCFFTETHVFEIRIDATTSPAKLIYLNNGTYEAKWQTEFIEDTWYNFGIGITAAPSGKGSVLSFYTSEGDKDLALVATHKVVTEFAPTEELHIGLLTLTADGKDPKMNKKQDIISFNGVSVENKVVKSAKV